MIRAVLVDLGEGEQRLGRLTFVGKGLSFSAFEVTVMLEGEATQVVVRLPHLDEEEDSSETTRRSIAVRRELARSDLAFRIAEPLGTAQTEAGLASVERWLPGAPMCDAMIQSMFDPVEVTASVAAACHAIDPAPFRSILGGPKTRRDHAERELEVLWRNDVREFQDARAWSAEHLPPDTPARLLHGDLLGQNILVSSPEIGSRDWTASVIDWSEVQLGDPAYDLAIVSRGHRKVFREGQSLGRLVDAYNERAAEPVEIAHVRIFELALKANWYIEELHEEGTTDHSVTLLNEFRSVLKRC